MSSAGAYISLQYQQQNRSKLTSAAAQQTLVDNSMADSNDTQKSVYIKSRTLNISCHHQQHTMQTSVEISVVYSTVDVVSDDITTAHVQ
jgi:hypothetical protein